MVVIDYHSHLIDEFDDSLGVEVARGGLASEHCGTGDGFFSLFGGELLDLEVSVWWEN